MTKRHLFLGKLSISEPGFNYLNSTIDPVEADSKYHTCEAKLTIPNVCENMIFSSDDLIDEGEIGRGSYGFVNRMIHRPTKTIMAVKRIRSTLNNDEQKKSLNDLDVVMHSAKCAHIVRFYGALFKEGDCWICMELMTTSLDHFYKFVYFYLGSHIPESILGKIVVAVVLALDYLKSELKFIHRDVKPSNILIDCKGQIKLCDFGISGQLIDSIARSRDVGCQPYMAPERIQPNLNSTNGGGYDIRSDVWSLGITLIELATGEFPYPQWHSIFEQLTYVINGESPTLPDRLSIPIKPRLLRNGNVWTSVDDRRQSIVTFGQEFRNFVSQCLCKDYKSRPKYQALMNHKFFIVSLSNTDVDVGSYFQSIIDQVPASMMLHDLHKELVVAAT